SASSYSRTIGCVDHAPARARVRARGRPPGAPARSASVTSTAAAALVLAVDGGNSKTDVALLDASGRLLSVARGQGSSPYELGTEGCVAVLEGLLERVL